YTPAGGLHVRSCTVPWTTSGRPRNRCPGPATAAGLTPETPRFQPEPGHRHAPTPAAPITPRHHNIPLPLPPARAAPTTPAGTTSTEPVRSFPGNALRDLCGADEPTRGRARRHAAGR